MSPNVDPEDSILRLLLKDTPPKEWRHFDPSLRTVRPKRDRIRLEEPPVEIRRNVRPDPEPPDTEVQSDVHLPHLRYLDEGLKRLSKELSTIRNQERDDMRWQLYQLSERVWQLQESRLPEVRPRRTVGTSPVRTWDTQEDYGELCPLCQGTGIRDIHPRDKLSRRESKAMQKNCYRCGSDQHYRRDCPWEAAARVKGRGYTDA